ncbi:MAG: isochorismatase family protein [Verrucomicrobia bacterium]|nr:isochorismatase family protein [Verrucomicrobiota bacterium]
MSPDEPASDAVASTLLLGVDLQPAFLAVMPGGGKPLLRRCELALRSAVGLGMRVAFTEQRPDRLGGTDAALLAHAPVDAPRWAKSSFSAYGDPVIRAALGAPDLEHLLLCGLETPVCVYQTAIDALGAGTAVTVLSDAVGARRPDDARVCLEALIRAGAHVLPVETVFYALLQDSTHPFFKAYTQLVKDHA